MKVADDSASTLDAWAKARRILCVRLDNLGDVLMCTPAMHALKHSAPGSSERHISLLASPSGAKAAPYLPDVDEVFVCQAPWMKHAAPLDAATDLGLCARLRQGAFDAAVIFTVYSQSALPAALFCHLAGIPLRLAHCRENPYGLLTDWVPETEPAQRIRHEAQRQLDLVASIGAGLPRGISTDATRMRFTVPPAARAAMQRRLEEMGLREDERLVVLHPGATAASRRYPPERYAEVAARLASRHACRVLVTGGSDETDLADTVCRLSRDVASERWRHPRQVHNLAGQLELVELAALIARSELLISNNSGPVHIASAVGTPVVDLYALTNPQHTPWQVPQRVLSHDVPCKYCYKSICPEGHNNCLRLISPDEVVAAACELLLEGRSPGARHTVAAQPGRTAPPSHGASHADHPISAPAISCVGAVRLHALPS